MKIVVVVSDNPVNKEFFEGDFNIKELIEFSTDSQRYLNENLIKSGIIPKITGILLVIKDKKTKVKLATFREWIYWRQLDDIKTK